MKKLRSGSSLVLGLVWLLIANGSTAGAYEIILGKGVDLCEACLENILRQSAEEAVCDRQYASELGLRKVEWMPLNLVEHTDLLKRMYKLLNLGNESARGVFDDPQQLKEYVEGGPARSGLPTIVLETGEADIDRDGTADRLLRYEQGKCRRMFSGWEYSYKSALVVFKEDGRSVDYTKTKLLVQYPHEGLKGMDYRDAFKVGILHYQMYQAFTYKGIVYFDKWDGGSRPADTNTLSIYETRQRQTRKLCQIRLFPPDVRPHH